MNNNSVHIYLYGPSGTGKSTTGRLLAEQLGIPFLDLDEQIAANAGQTIAEIFASDGEAGFRRRESAALAAAAMTPAMVVALGGGALLASGCRRLAQETGQVVCLSARLEVLAKRLGTDQNQRPLLAVVEGYEKPSEMETHPTGAIRSRLQDYLERRVDHYGSFPLQLDVSEQSPEQTAWEIQICLGRFRVSGMGKPYDVRVIPGGLERLGDLFRECGLDGPVALVSDSNVAPLYAPNALASLGAAGYQATLVSLPAGEEYKTVATIQELWNGFLAAGLDRSSTVLAVGGGVTGDLAGFAAATFLRGVRWVGVPTSLLAMVDASLGGKTGADLPQGKNLIGAFHPPALVLADPNVLASLPDAELRSGLAEALKHGVIADPRLFELCAQGWDAALANLPEIVRRAMAVKIQVIQEDPFEQGRRAALNLGHTLGHAVELASDYRLRHGEAVAIGMVAAARHAERIGLSEAGLATQIAEALVRLGLPIEIPAGLERARIIAGIGVDKKRKGGKVRLALPVQIGEVRVGIELDREDNLFG